jgi:hypothetical protein
MIDEICRRCGAHKKNYREMMHSDCGCEIDSPDYITKVLKQLFRRDELASPELESVIKGKG